MAGCFLGINTFAAVDPRREEMKNAIKLDKTYLCEIKESVLDDSYVIGKELGTGAFGTVYSGTRTSDNKPVAMKCLKENEIVYYWQQDGGKKIPMEIHVYKMLANIQGILPLLDVFSTQDGYVLITEQPTNPVQDLRNYLNRKLRPISEKKTRKIINQVIRIMIEVAKAGVYHQDLKPSNLLIEPKTGRIYLIDFGSAQLVEQSPYFTYYGTSVCKPREMITEGWCLDEPATVWSIGILAYRIMTGQFPFNTDQEIRESQLSYKNRIGIEFRDFIGQCLTKNPTTRPNLSQLLDHQWMNQI